MNIKILDSWLREFLETKARPSEIAKYVSLCGPSVEKVEKIGNDFVYDIEVTTNRIDTASVYGIAREASSILPRFGIQAKLRPIRPQSKDYVFAKTVPYLSAVVDQRLCPRFTAVLIRDVEVAESSELIQKRLESAGMRPINNIIDIANYVMLELGQPVHTFDYGKIGGKKMILRESKKGEHIVTLDGKEFTLAGGDIVIEDGTGNLIDLAGIMGGENSAIDENTKDVLLFVQTYNPTNIRKTSMYLSQRTQAATIFEKGTDEELVGPAILKALELFKPLSKAGSYREILNIYPKPYKTPSVTTTYEYINKLLGIDINKKDITTYLVSLGFECKWTGNKLKVEIPSFRAKDIKSQEDILEEVARIYGYHNLPSKVMSGDIPERPEDSKFAFERNIKNIVSGFGGGEVYTLSLVSKEMAREDALKLKNPLGTDTEYLRTSLLPSLVFAAENNKGIYDKFHLFEIANVYLPRKNNLPEEKMTFAGIFSGYSYRSAKGVIEAILNRLNIDFSFIATDLNGFSASHSALIKSGDKEMGMIGVLESGFIFYEFSVQTLMSLVKPLAYKKISKYPPQIEDLTFVLPEKTKIGSIIDSIKAVSKLIDLELKDIYKDSYTFRIWYQDKTKTLTDQEVKDIREKVLSSLKNKFGISVKE